MSDFHYAPHVYFEGIGVDNNQYDFKISILFFAHEDSEFNDVDFGDELPQYILINETHKGEGEISLKQYHHVYKNIPRVPEGVYTMVLISHVIDNQTITKKKKVIWRDNKDS